MAAEEGAQVDVLGGEKLVRCDLVPIEELKVQRVELWRVDQIQSLIERSISTSIVLVACFFNLSFLSRITLKAKSNVWVLQKRMHFRNVLSRAKFATTDIWELKIMIIKKYWTTTSFFFALNNHHGIFSFSHRFIFAHKTLSIFWTSLKQHYWRKSN